MNAPTLQTALTLLESIAPVRLAGSWDNVGLLLQGHRPVHRIGLTIDLTAAVTDELLAANVDLVLAYHPPIFSGLKRLTHGSPRSHALLKLIREGVHVYSPHTALDAASGGMAEWLLEPFGALVDSAPIAPDAEDPTVGAGRMATLAEPGPLEALLPTLRAHLGLTHLRVAGDLRQRVSSVAVCPGAGGSLFESVGQADLFVTGEMRHHDVLGRVEKGQCVVLTDHTNTERGYLSRLAERLQHGLGVPVITSIEDRDPLTVWG